MTTEAPEHNYFSWPPKAFNAELRKIYQLLPHYAFEDAVDLSAEYEEETTRTSEEILEKYRSAYLTIDRRSKSELKKVLMARLTLLLEHTQGTQAFRSFVGDVFSEQFDVGDEKDDLPEDYLFSWMLDLKDSESAGIFDPEKVMDMAPHHISG